MKSSLLLVGVVNPKEKIILTLVEIVSSVCTLQSVGLLLLLLVGVLGVEVDWLSFVKGLKIGKSVL